MKSAAANTATHPNQFFMELAIQEALSSRKAGDYAIGAVIVKDDEIIVKAGNRVKLDQDPTHHAEILAIRQAAKNLGKRHLEGCVLYTTHEPCPMCAATAVFAKMAGIVAGAKIEDMVDFRSKNGNDDWSWRTIDIPTSLVLEKGIPTLFFIEEFMREECKKLFHCL